MGGRGDGGREGEGGVETKGRGEGKERVRGLQKPFTRFSRFCCGSRGVV